MKHKSSKDEIAGLLKIAERDLRLAEKLTDDNDWQFAIAYNAVLQLATIPMRASGYRATSKVGHHWITLMLLPEFIGKELRKQADYFDECRVKRNITEYKLIGDISLADALELIDEAKKLKRSVISWLKKNHSQYL